MHRTGRKNLHHSMTRPGINAAVRMTGNEFQRRRSPGQTAHCCHWSLSMSRLNALLSGKGQDPVGLQTDLAQNMRR
jgi:hypothetical protein